MKRLWWTTFTHWARFRKSTHQKSMLHNRRPFSLSTLLNTWPQAAFSFLSGYYEWKMVPYRYYEAAKKCLNADKHATLREEQDLRHRTTMLFVRWDKKGIFTNCLSATGLSMRSSTFSYCIDSTKPFSKKDRRCEMAFFCNTTKPILTSSTGLGAVEFLSLSTTFEHFARCIVQ